MQQRLQNGHLKVVSLSRSAPKEVSDISLGYPEGDLEEEESMDWPQYRWPRSRAGAVALGAAGMIPGALVLAFGGWHPAEASLAVLLTQLLVWRFAYGMRPKLVERSIALAFSFGLFVDGVWGGETISTLFLFPITAALFISFLYCWHADIGE